MYAPVSIPLCVSLLPAAGGLQWELRRVAQSIISFSSRKGDTRFALVSWARRGV